MKYLTGAMAALAATCHGAFGADLTATPLDPVVVTATRIPQQNSHATQAATVITAEDIERGGYRDVTEVLQALGGVEITTSGGAGQPSAVFMRGAEGRHTLVLVDGLRIGSATAGGTAFEHLALSQIERIEVVRGPLSGVYGPDAIGGAIQIFTRSAASGSRVRAGLGTYRTRDAAMSLGRTVGDTEFAVSASALDTLSFDANKPTTPFAQHNPDTDAYRNRSLSAKVTHHFSESHEAGFTGFMNEGAAHFDAGAATDDVNRQTVQGFALHSRNRITDRWTSLVRVGTTRDTSASVGAFPGYFTTDQHQLTWQNTVDMAGGTLLGGLEYLDQRVSSNTIFKSTSRRVSSAFGGYQGAWGSHGVQLNVRTDENSQFGTRNTGNAGYSYRLTDLVRVRAAVGTAFKAPTFNDLYFPDTPPFFFSNPNLRPERSRSREAGMDLSHAAHRLSVTAFQNRIADLITVVTDPVTFVSTTQNLTSVIIEGAEFEHRWQGSQYEARTRVTLQSPRDEATGAQLRRRAREFGSFRVQRKLGAWRWSSEIVGSGERFDSTTEARNTRLNGYALVNLAGEYAFARDWSVGARWNNVFDRKYEHVQFFNTPRSNLYLWLAWQTR